MEHIVDFYKDFGVGKLGLHKAFRLEHKNPAQTTEIIPITRVAHVKLDDLVGYELEKKKLTDNTEAFLAGKPANNCLLFGDAGTGKSTCIKAILNQYYEKGLRIIEVYKHQFQDLNDVIAQIKNRNYKFIIYMDDLSFEDFEIEYKYLKAVIEGGLEKKPNNVLIYATSNRRHLIRESFRVKMNVTMIYTPMIPYRKNCPWFHALVLLFILAHRRKKNFRILCLLWLSEMKSICRKMKSWQKRIFGNCSMAVFPDELRSSLSTI